MPRKRQRTSKAREDGSHAEKPLQSQAASLERLVDDESKDDEERRLESFLFGAKYVPKEKDVLDHDVCFLTSCSQQ